MQSMFGIETEYAFGLLSRRSDSTQRDALIDEFVAAAARKLPHLRGRESPGFFLVTGGRLYRDCNRLELTTPETTNPWDTCRYLLACDRLLLEVVAALNGNPRFARLLLSRCNVCYSGSGSTSGCHESYRCRSPILAMAAHLIPFLVTRIPITGAGGFNNLSPGLDFSMSPRVFHLTQEVSDSSTHERGIFHTKSESLSRGGTNRLHVLVGESLCSELGNWLKVATTALVVALVDGDVMPGTNISLSKPRCAMRRLATDLRCRAVVELDDGRRLRALDIQRHYQQLAARHVGASFMPDWAAEACRAWGEVLDRLDRGWSGVDRTLDWAIKRSLYERFAAARGFSWLAIEKWSLVARRLQRALEAAGSPLWSKPLGPEALAADGPIGPTVERLTPWLHARGLTWGQFGPFMTLRSQLFEIDTRFSQLGEAGIFTALDRAGVLEHHVPGVDNIEHAMTNPPAAGRARLRGEAVRNFAGDNGCYSCDWTGVWDHRSNRFLDLSDPCATSAMWRQLSAGESLSLRHMRSTAAAAVSEVAALYARGHYEAAHAHLHSALRYRPLLESTQTDSLLRHAAWLQARRGFLDGPEYLDELARLHGSADALVIDYICVYCFEGLAPIRTAELDVWVDRARQRLGWSDDQPPTSSQALAFREHYGRLLLSGGQPRRAVEVLEVACTPELCATLDSRIHARMLCTLADAYRQIGERCRALNCLRQAQQMQESDRFDGDLADFALTGRARLSASPRRARSWLARAMQWQSSVHNRVGYARSLLLEARCKAPARTAAGNRVQLETLRAELPALGRCGLLSKILDRWDAWTRRAMPDDETDFFWGL